MLKHKFIPRRSLFDNLLDRGPMLTPLIDIMFLVLIFFMVNNNPTQRSLGVTPPHMASAPRTASAKQEAGAEQQALTEDKVFLLAVRPDLSYSIQVQSGSTVLEEWHRPAAKDTTTMRQHLNTLQTELQQVSRIRLRADRSLDYGTVIAISEILYTWDLPLELDVSDLNTG